MVLRFPFGFQPLLDTRDREGDVQSDRVKTLLLMNLDSADRPTAGAETIYNMHGNSGTIGAGEGSFLNGTGELRNFKVEIGTNSFDAACTIKVRGQTPLIDTGLTVTIPAGTTGSFIDSHHIGKVNADDVYHIFVDATSTTTGTISFGCSTEFIQEQ